MRPRACRRTSPSTARTTCGASTPSPARRPIPTWRSWRGAWVWQRARAWRRLHPVAPADVAAGDITWLAYGSRTADLLGVPDRRMHEALRRAAENFSAADFLDFDPARELPPADVPDTCTRCLEENERGLRLLRHLRQRAGHEKPLRRADGCADRHLHGRPLRRAPRRRLRGRRRPGPAHAALSRLRGRQQPRVHRHRLRRHPHRLHAERLRHLAARPGMAAAGARLPAERTCR